MKRFYLSKLVILTTLLAAGWNVNLQAQTTTFSYSGSTVTYTVPVGCTLVGINAIGAQGGNSSSFVGGHGASMYGAFVVTPGQVLKVMVGQQNTTGGGNAGGGGGGSFVWDNVTSTLMIAAGGGGGGGYSSSAGNGLDASITTNGVSGAGGYNGGGIGGNGGTEPTSFAGYTSWAAGGGGWLSGGNNGSGCGATGGQTPLAGGAGGNAGSTSVKPGGFGGGGGADARCGIIGGGGGGGYSGGGCGCDNNSQYQPGGGGGSFNGGTSQTNIVSTATGNGQVTIAVLCAAPGTISGNVPVCPTSNITLTESTAGGTWSSSNPAVATVGSATGIVTGIVPGNAVITYTVVNPCGPFTTATVTVSPTPSALSAAVVCPGTTNTLTDTASGGVWSSSNNLIATVGTGGVVTGVAAGTATITYTLPSGCFATSVATVNPLPPLFTVTGGGAYCSGGTGVHVGLSGSTSGFTYQVMHGGAPVGSATGGGTTIDFGLFTGAGVYTIVATNPATGCTNTMTGSATISINPLPAAITGVTNVCVGGTTTLSDATPGGLWSSSNPAQATVVIGTGVVSGVFAGTPFISYTLTSTGCSSRTSVLVNANPPAFVGASGVCVGATTSLSDLSVGGSWSSSNSGLASVGASTGIVTGISSGIVNITYTLTTSCYTTSPMVVNSLPDTTNTVIGGGGYCAGGTGVHVDLSFSNSGINYQLYNGSTPTGSVLPGSNSSLDFGAETASGTYTVKGTNTLTGCTSQMAGSVTVSIIALTPLHTMTGGGSYCAGGAGLSLGLDGSTPGIMYQLYNAATPVGLPVTGSGSLFNFGVFTTPGTYTVVANDPATGCTEQMTGSETITINSLPFAYTMSSGGSYCAGGTGVDITLINSDAGVTYTLLLGISPQAIVTSIGGSIDFGQFTVPGVYTIVGNNGTCSNNMLGSAVITVNPTPTVYTVTGGGGYCAGGTGEHIGLNFSNSGIKYQLWDGPVATGLPVTGSGGSIDFGVISSPGTYTVTAVNPTTACGSNMSGSAIISINLPPITYNVTGGGSYCIGGTGLPVGTDFSETGIHYQLYRGTTPVGPALSGTGPGINFGVFTNPGVYTVVATNPGTGCTTNLNGAATIVVNPLPNSYTTTGGGNFCAFDTGVHIKLSNSDIGVNYELYYNGFPTGTILAGTGTALDFGLVTGGGIYTVVAINGTTLCTKNMPGSATVIVNPSPNPFNVIGGGNYCPGAPGVHVGLDGSSTGVNYQLISGGVLGTPLAGSGAPLDFGALTTTGIYAVVATNLITGCTGLMNGNATVGTNPVPTNYTVSGGGSYCIFGSGEGIILSGSDVGTNYQVYLGGVMVGAATPGNGLGSLPLGTFTAAGLYTVKATNGSGCIANMTGSAFINIVSPAVYSVTGGGNFCAGGTGVIVGQAGSSATETYQLNLGGAPTGPAVSGTGAPLNFGLQTGAGIYTVVATNILYGCTDTMAGTATVGINPLPALNSVTGGGSYCAGGTGSHVMLSGSGAGIQYQLYKGWATAGSPISGTGIAIDFGAETGAGTYNVIATNMATSCSDTMADSAVITVKPVPHAYIVTVQNDGNYCAADTGLHIGLASSDAGIKYQLYRGSTAVGGTIPGNGSSLDMGLQTVAGTYIITGTDTTNTCSNNMLGSATVNIIPLPTVHNVMGGGSYCRGGSGVDIGLDGSDPGIYYELFDGPYSAGGLLGTGAPLDFGMQIALGNYMVVGNSVITTCPNNMFGIATVAYEVLPTPVVTIRAYPGTGVGVWHIDSIKAFVSNAGTSPTYQWVINGNIIAGATNESFTNHQFYNADSVTCLVTGSGPCGGNTTAESVVLVLYNVGVPVVTSGGNDVKLIPNPNKGTFTVKGNLGTAIDEEVTLEVVNMMGQILFSNKIMTQNGNINERIELSNALANGMYMLNLRSGSQNSVFHFVIEQ